MTGKGRPGPERRPLADRFWAKVDTRGEDECWPWRGAADASGYGRIQMGGNSSGKSPLFAHRVSYALTHNVPERSLEVVMHSCDNPICVNPAHLSHGTHRENHADAAAKGRAYWQRADRDTAGRFR